jgi:hypothetical protein
MRALGLPLPGLFEATGHRPLCAVAGWICHWRKIGQMSVLARRGGAMLSA